MQTQIQQITQRILSVLITAWGMISRLIFRGVTLARNAWAWWRDLKKPEIPLTPFQWIALFYLIFGLTYIWATPIFEASDEVWHFGMVEAISQGNLPVQDVNSDVVTPWRQEGSQPPLYYYAAAALISPIDISDAPEYREYNPHGQIGITGFVGNKNIVLHDTEPPALQGTPLAVYVLRVAGLIMGVGTIWAVFQCGKLVSPQRPSVAWLAAAITAFNPMFIFISASVNNDNLVILFNSFIIYLVLLTLRDGFKWQRSVIIAMLFALATLSKLSALALAPAIGLAALWVMRRDKDVRGFVILIGSMVIIWGVASGWWYLRNIAFYGELFGTSTMAQVAGVRDEPFTFGTLLQEFQGFRYFYWGIFGAANIQATPLLYAIMDMMVFIALSGLLFLVLQLAAIQDFAYARREMTSIVFLLGIIIPGMIALIAWTAQTYASQGRLMFPFLAAISPLLAAGFIEIIWWSLFLLSPPDRSFVRAGDAVSAEVLRESVSYPVWGLAITAFLIPFGSIAPQYLAPSPLDDLPEGRIISRLDAQYGDIELIGYETQDRRHTPGNKIPMTFYWRVLEQSDIDYSLALSLIDPTGEEIGKLDTYPGAGTLRTSTWEAGKIYQDTYMVETQNVVNGRYPFSVKVDWWDIRSREYLQPIEPETETELAAIVLPVGAMSAPPFGETVPQLLVLPLEESRQAEFETQIALTGFSFDADETTLIIEWAGRNGIEHDYTVFVHAYDEAGNLAGQRDVSPVLPTHYWFYDERFVTKHPLDWGTDDGEPLPGTYTLKTGWYRMATVEAEDGTESAEIVRLLLPLPPDEEDESRRPDAYTLFEFTVNDDGTVESEDYAILWDDWMERPPPTEITAEVSPDVENTASAEATEAVTVVPGLDDADSTESPDATEDVDITEEAAQSTEEPESDTTEEASTTEEP